MLNSGSSPAACQVEPEVSSLRSISTTSDQPLGRAGDHDRASVALLDQLRGDALRFLAEEPHGLLRQQMGVHVDADAPDNYPLVNGTPIGAQVRRLVDNDVIQLAGVKMGFFES